MTTQATKQALSGIQKAARRARAGKSHVAKDESMAAILKRLDILEAEESEEDEEPEGSEAEA